MLEISKEQKNTFRNLFRGREDVFATSWEKNKVSGYTPAYEVDWKAYNKFKAQGGSFKTLQEKNMLHLH